MGESDWLNRIVPQIVHEHGIRQEITDYLIAIHFLILNTASERTVCPRVCYVRPARPPCPVVHLLDWPLPPFRPLLLLFVHILVRLSDRNCLSFLVLTYVIFFCPSFQRISVPGISVQSVSSIDCPPSSV